MKPDMDEYADIDETRPNASRAMSWMVLAVAVGGFAALAYYAYHSGIKAGADHRVSPSRRITPAARAKRNSPSGAVLGRTAAGETSSSANASA